MTLFYHARNDQAGREGTTRRSCGGRGGFIFPQWACRRDREALKVWGPTEASPLFLKGGSRAFVGDPMGAQHNGLPFHRGEAKLNY